MLDAATLKEIRSSSRQAGTYASRVAYLGIAGLFLYQFWMSVSSHFTLQMSDYADFGRALFARFAPLQMVLITIAAVGSSAERIVRERLNGTLGVLLSTPLSAESIVRAKWRASFLHSASLALAGVPALALCVFLGVDPHRLLSATVTTLSLALLGSAFGLRASAYANGVPKALLYGVLYFLGFTLLPLAVVLMGGWPVIFLVPFFHPVYAGIFLFTESGGLYALSWLSAALVSYGVARWVLAGATRVMVAKVRVLPEERPGEDDAPPDRPAFRRLPSADDPDADLLLRREFLARPGARLTPTHRFIGFCGLMLVTLLFWSVSLGRDFASFLFLASGYALLSIVAGGVLFAPEKENRRIELLLSTPLSSPRIIFTKMLAALMGAEALLCLIGTGALALLFSWWAGPSGIFITLLVTWVALAGLYLLSAWASLRCRTATEAFLLAGGLVSMLVIFLPLAVALLAPPGTAGRQLPAYLYLPSCLNPVWVLDVLSGVGRDPQAGKEAMARGLLFAAFWIAGGLGIAGWMSLRGGRSLGRP